MAAAVLTEEQLQNSLATSEDDADFEEDDELSADILAENAASYAANIQLQNGLLAEQGFDDEEDAEGSEEEMLSDVETGADDDEEDDVEMPDSPANDAEEETDPDETEEEGEEGVGAVKIQHKSLEDDDDVATESEDDDDESAASAQDDDESKDSTDAEIEGEWEPAAEEEEEEEEDAANPNRCIFCLLDEENDPNEEFELYLACGVCGDNAHRQCARNALALKSDDEAEIWYCPDCVTNKLVPVPDAPEVEQEPLDDASARRISRDRIAGDLLPSQRAIKPDSHSVFNQLIAPDDPMDGSRLLRKRKASSDGVEPTVEEPSSSRRRTREQANSANHSHDRPTILPVEKPKINGVSSKPEAVLTNGDSKADPATNARSSRSLRPKVATPIPKVRILSKSAKSLVMAFRVDALDLQHIFSQPPKPKKKSRPTPASRSGTMAPSTTTFVPSIYTQPFYSLHDKEVDELKSKPYGGILDEQEADTTMTLPRPEHRRQFDEARQKAEEDWKARVAIAAEAALASGVKKPRKVSGPASQIEYIEFGQFQIDIWYAAPYPEEYSRNKALFICEFCLKYMESDIVAWRHKTKCPWKHPPGDEIYRDGKVMIFEVDGRKNPLYCQNLCLLAKLFLGSKTLYYDVEPFLFYVMTEYDELGCHFVGYFSKEKRPSSLNNVSCILVLPIHQRKGYGHLLIDFSYLLTRVEKKTGSPEKPLSDMGLVSYRNYWRLVLCYYLKDFKSGDKIPSIKRISDDMGLTPDDVISALDALGALIRDPQTGVYGMRLQTDYYLEVIRLHESKGYAKLNPKGLVWTPYIMGRGNASTFEHGPPLNTVAPREDDEDEIPEKSRTSSLGKREIDGLNGNNGDTDAVIDSLGKLTTESGESTRLTGSEGGSYSSGMNGFAKKASYYEAAASIPATRFEVFPPVPALKARGTPRPTTARPSTARPKTTPRPPPRRPSGDTPTQRSTPSRSQTSHRRRSVGGTGRGPGRWPKGTKMSDFGNAMSGPGLPPGLVKQRSRLGHEVLLGDEDEGDVDMDYHEHALEDEEEEHEDEEEEDDEEDEEDEDPDAILYETPAVRKRTSTTRGQGLGKPFSIGKALGGVGKTPQPPVSTVESDIMADIDGDFEDIDAEGEDE